jgi:hypothetical protein
LITENDYSDREERKYINYFKWLFKKAKNNNNSFDESLKSPSKNNYEKSHSRLETENKFEENICTRRSLSNKSKINSFFNNFELSQTIIDFYISLGKSHLDFPSNNYFFV